MQDDAVRSVMLLQLLDGCHCADFADILMIKCHFRNVSINHRLPAKECHACIQLCLSTFMKANQQAHQAKVPSSKPQQTTAPITTWPRALCAFQTSLQKYPADCSRISDNPALTTTSHHRATRPQQSHNPNYQKESYRRGKNQNTYPIHPTDPHQQKPWLVATSATKPVKRTWLSRLAW